MKGFIYVIGAQTHKGWRFKISRTNNVGRRFRKLFTMSPSPLILTHTFPADDASAAERELHDIYRMFREHGEWFNLTPDDVLAIMCLKAFINGQFILSLGLLKP